MVAFETEIVTRPVDEVLLIIRGTKTSATHNGKKSSPSDGKNGVFEQRQARNRLHGSLGQTH